MRILASILILIIQLNWSESRDSVRVDRLKSLALLCPFRSDFTYEWFKNGQPLVPNYTYMDILSIGDRLTIFDPLGNLEFGNYTCMGGEINEFEIIIPDYEIYRRQTKKEFVVIVLIKSIITGYLDFAAKNPFKSTLIPGFLAIVLIAILSRIGSIYREASINYAKYKFIYKGNSLTAKINSYKAQKERTKKQRMSRARKKAKEKAEETAMATKNQKS